MGEKRARRRIAKRGLVNHHKKEREDQRTLGSILDGSAGRVCKPFPACAAVEP